MPDSTTNRTYPVRGLVGMAAFVLALTLWINPALKPLQVPQLVVEVVWQALLLLADLLFATYDGLGIRSLNPGRKWNKRDWSITAVGLLLFSFGSGTFNYLLRAHLPKKNPWYDEIVSNFKAMDPLVFSVVAISFALLIGLCEELVFRSYVISRLRSSGLSAWASILVSAAGFGLIHLPYEGLIAAIGVALFWGLPAGYFFHRRGAILPLIAAHSLVDALAFVAAYLIPLHQGSASGP